MVEPDIIYDAKTGVSGAGRSGNVKYNFSELNDNTQAYSVSGHRHQPEMTQELSALSRNGDVTVTFTPHLVSMTRGILAPATRGSTKAWTRPGSTRSTGTSTPANRS